MQSFVVAKMVTLLITSFFILALVVVALYFWHKPASAIRSETLPPSPGRGLFVDGTPDGLALAAAAADADAKTSALHKRNEILERAKTGDKSTLQEAQADKDALLYEEVLNSLVAVSSSEAALLSLVSYITRNNFPVNRTLAEAFIDSSKSAPNRSTTAKMLHVAALSNDAAVYQKAVETALEFWRNGSLSGSSAQELRFILEGEFWILSSPTRSSGAGFLLKRALIDSIFRNQASESSAMAYLQNRHEEQERAEARVRAHLLKYHVDVVNVLICHIHLPEELMKTQTEKILAEQRQNMYNAQREAEEKRIQLERTKSQADNQKDLMAATVGVEIAGKRAEQRKSEGEGEAHYISQTGKAEAEKVRLMGEAQGVAYREQVNALGAQGVALVEVLKVIGEKGVRITPDIMASGSGGEAGGGGGIGTLLLLNLFRNQMSLPSANGEKKS